MISLGIFLTRLRSAVETGGIMIRTIRLFLLFLGLWGTSAICDQDGGFFTDPSLLKPWDQGTFDLGYVDPDILQKAQRYSAVMVDQPEIQIASDSKYKSAKADDLKQLADVGRLAMIERLEAGGGREDLVAERVTEAVVDLLEVVHVDHEIAQRVRSALLPLHLEEQRVFQCRVHTDFP